MAQVVYSEYAFTDLERLTDFLAETDRMFALETAVTIQDAVAILEHHPLIGRPCEHGLRELVISRGRTGYVALYDFLEADNTVLVLAIRHQREAGFVE